VGHFTWIWSFLYVHNVALGCTCKVVGLGYSKLRPTSMFALCHF